MERTITFGKYKGKAIKELILTHLGYIMWCLSNMAGFKLTEDEQQLYDMMAIAVLKSEVKTSYPKEELKKYVKDTWALEVTKETPFDISNDGDVYCPPYKVRELGLDKYRRRRAKPLGLSDLAGVQREINAMYNDLRRDFDCDEYVEDGLREDLFY